MKKIFGAALAAMLALAPLRGPAEDDLLARMAAVNAGLHSYTATMQAHVALTTFPFLSTDVTANVYHKDPDLNKVEITSGLPMVANQFGKLYPHIEPASRWNEVFVVSKIADDGAHTTYRLVPRVTGNLDHIDAVVDDRTATVSSMRWNYSNGGSAVMNCLYGHVQGQIVITSQTGSVEEPNYKGTITARLSDYKINPQLDDSVFNPGS
jgi:hypothetical protein